MANVLSAELLRGMDLVSFPAGAKIFSKGDKAEKAYLLLKGDVALIGVNAEGKNVAQGRIAPGQIFGELALIDGNVRPFHAVAIAEASCAVIDEDLMSSRLSKVDPFMRYWIEFMSQRLTELSQRTDAVKATAHDKSAGDTP